MATSVILFFNPQRQIEKLSRLIFLITDEESEAQLTVSPILSPEQDLRPGMTSPFRQVALKDRDSSSGTSWSSSSTLERIFWQHQNNKNKNNPCT